jgi:hypothetical protein
MLMLDGCMVCAKCTKGSEIVLDAPMALLGDEAQVEARLGILMQDRCMVPPNIP